MATLPATAQEPVLDASGQPVTGIRYSADGAGNTVKNRLWKGYFVSDFEGAAARMDALHSSFRPREDDVYILAYPKCGTHWLHEICHFLLTRQAERRPARKEDTMLECEDAQILDQLPSPRILNCHVRWSLMPKSITDSSKIVYVVRNPKDTAVSLFHHYETISDYEYSGTFSGFLTLYERGHLDGGSWFDHVRDFLTETKATRSNVLLVEYENLKRSPMQEIRRIADFLLGAEEAATLGSELLDAVCQKVSFSSMRADRSADYAEFFNEKAIAGFYRKGEVGDWRNRMSDEESRRIDELTATALKGLEQLYQPVYE